MNEEDAFRIMDHYAFLEINLAKRALYYATHILYMTEPSTFDLSYVSFDLFELVYDSPYRDKFKLYNPENKFVGTFDVPRDFLFAELLTPELITNHKLLQLEFAEGDL